MNKYFSFALTVTISVMLIALMTFSLMALSAPIQAAPALAPTPIAAPGSPGTPANIVFFQTRVVTADTRSDPLQLAAYNRLDLQYVIDQTAVSGEVNTTTLTFQTSCTGQNWDAGLAVVSANAADAQAVQVFANACRYQSILADTTLTTIPVTITVLGVAKN